MFSPQFLAQLRAYLSANNPGMSNSGIGALAPTAPEADDLSKGITAGLSSYKQHAVSQSTKPKTYIPGGTTIEQMPIPVTVRQPPAGYRPGYDPEWDYGIANPQSATDINSYNIERTAHMAAGGMASSPRPQAKPTEVSHNYPSTGNPVADARVAAGDQRVINNLKASAMYAAQDHARNGTPVPTHLQGWVDNTPQGRPLEGGIASTGAGPTGFFGKLLTGNFNGYNNYWDMVNGGGKGGSYANPGTDIRGLGAVAQDLKLGGIGALARDSLNGGGLGAAGDSFANRNKFAILANLAGIKPAGQEGAMLTSIAPTTNPEAQAFWDENQKYRAPKTGTEGTTPTGQADGGIVDSGVPVHFASGGIADIPDPAQPPAGNEKDLISTAIAAIKGQVSDPRPVLGAFLAKYGEDALRNLVDKVHSGEIDKTAAKSEGILKGPGDGMDDRIPAKVHNGHDVLLANNEYIVPADVVSALGNGSTDAGAEHLDNMLNRVRTAAHGTTKQQKKVSAEKVLPA